MPTSPEQIKAILESIDHDYRSESKDDGAWTQRIFEEIGRLGHTNGYYVCTKKSLYSEANYGEWLFDQCWLEYEEALNPNTPLLSVPLALECEWQMGVSYIKHDFEKLLVSNANLKVMIFQQKDLTDAQVVCAKLMNYIECFDPRRYEQYLLCCYVNEANSNGFYFEVVSYCRSSEVDGWISKID